MNIINSVLPLQVAPNGAPEGFAVFGIGKLILHTKVSGTRLNALLQGFRLFAADRDALFSQFFKLFYTLLHHSHIAAQLLKEQAHLLIVDILLLRQLFQRDKGIIIRLRQ